MELLNKVKDEIDKFNIPIGRHNLKEVVLEAFEIIENFEQAHCDDQVLIAAQNEEIAMWQARFCQLKELLLEVKDDLPPDLVALCEHSMKEAGC